MTNIEPLTNKINLVLGTIAAFLAYIFGRNWVLFAAFLALNFSDFLTRWIAARITGTENSKSAFVGILKKLGYWIMIALGFGMGVIFVEMGNVIGINLEVTTLLGWFVLSTLIINEIRSNLENLVEIYGDKIPTILIKGLDVADKAIDGVIQIGDEGVETQLHKSESEIQAKGKAVMRIKDVRSK